MLKLLTAGSGGRLAPLRKIVTRHQTTSRTTITLVTFMIFNALSLDSCMPLMFCHQK